MAVEHYWPGAGGGSDASIGDLAPGGSRAYFDVQSQSSAPGSQQTARLFLASDASRLFAYDSTGTYLVGTAFGGEHATDAGSGYWARQTGSFVSTAASGTTDVIFPVSFLSLPNIVQTITAGAGGAVTFLGIVGSQTSLTGFRSSWSAVGAPGSRTFSWTALGIVSSASY
jgi:hypothetical protein